MKYLISFLIAFILMFVIYLIFVVFNKKKVNKIFESYGAIFIKSRFKVTFKDANPKKFAWIMAVSDSFICAAAFVIMTLIENIYISFIVAAITLIILIFGVYSIVGLIYKKKEGQKNV